MLQKDYILRLLRELTDALEVLIKEKDRKGVPECRRQLQSLYRSYFNHPHGFYYEQDADYILNDLRQQCETDEEFLVRTDMLAELLYQDAQLLPSAEQAYLLRKSLPLFEYADANSRTYSVERRDKILQMQEKLGK